MTEKGYSRERFRKQLGSLSEQNSSKRVLKRLSLKGLREYWKINYETKLADPDIKKIDSIIAQMNEELEFITQFIVDFNYISVGIEVGSVGKYLNGLGSSRDSLMLKNFILSDIQTADDREHLFDEIRRELEQFSIYKVLILDYLQNLGGELNLNFRDLDIIQALLSNKLQFDPNDYTIDK